MISEPSLHETMPEARAGRERGPYDYYVLAGILLLYLFLALFKLGEKSLWLDEAYSIRDAYSLHPFNRTHPLYFWMLSLWIRLGSDEFTLRFLSVPFGGASILLIYFLARAAFDSRTGLIAALLLTLSLPHLFYSRQARFYAPFFFACLVEMIIFIRLTRKPDIKGFAAYLPAALASIGLNPTGVFLNLAQNIYALFNLRSFKPFAKRWFALQAILAVPAVAALLWLRPTFQLWRNQWINFLPEPSLLQVPLELGRLIFFYYGGEAEMSAGLPLPVRSLYVFMAVLSVLVLALSAWIITRRKWRHEPALVLIWLLSIVAGLYITSLFGIRLWYHRYLYFAAAPLIILFSFCITLFKRPALIAAVLLVHFSIFGALYYVYLDKPYTWGEDWRGVAEVLERGRIWDKAPVVLAPHGCYKYPLKYYYPEIEADLEYMVLPLGRTLSLQDCSNLIQPYMQKHQSFWLVLHYNFFRDIDTMRIYLEYYRKDRILKREKRGSINIYLIEGFAKYKNPQR